MTEGPQVRFFKGKTEIYMDMYKQMKSDDRLPAGWTLGQYHKAYAQAFKSAIKTVDPTWDYGIIYTPNSAEAHKTLPLRTARVHGRL